MTGQPQRHPAPRRGDNPQDLVGDWLGIAGHQRVSEQEPRYLFPLGEGIPDGRGIRRRRPPWRRSQEQWRRAATAAGIGRALYRRRTGRSASVRSAAAPLRWGAGISWRRNMACRAGRHEDGAYRHHQAGNPSHATTINVAWRGGKNPIPQAHLPCGLERSPTCRQRGEAELTGRVGGTRTRATATPTRSRCTLIEPTREAGDEVRVRARNRRQARRPSRTILLGRLPGPPPLGAGTGRPATQRPPRHGTRVTLPNRKLAGHPHHAPESAERSARDPGPGIPLLRDREGPDLIRDPFGCGPGSRSAAGIGVSRGRPVAGFSWRR